MKKVRTSDGEPMTAGQLLAHQQTDAAQVEQRAAFEADRLRRVAAARSELQALISDLRKLDVPVSSATELKPTLVESYPTIVDLLISHLEPPYSRAARVVVASALITPTVRRSWKELLNKYVNETDTLVKGTLANAILVSVDDAGIRDVIELIQSAANGDSRVILLEALVHSSIPEARAALIAAASDQVLGLEARALLRGEGELLLPSDG